MNEFRVQEFNRKLREFVSSQEVEWRDRITIWCRENDGPCICGCHLTNVND